VNIYFDESFIWIPLKDNSKPLIWQYFGRKIAPCLLGFADIFVPENREQQK
jgi:hypothetical protein